jgi:AcrR family transcriptional regulator
LVAAVEIMDGLPAGAWRQVDDHRLSPILAAALDAFYEVGYHGTSVRAIARRAGLTVPALYYHHINKEAILAALLDYSIMSVIERAEQALEEAGPEPDARFRNLIECLVLYMAHHRKSAAMDAEIRALGPENHREYSEKRRIIERMLTGTIESGVRAGLFDVSSPKDTARALLGMIQAVATWYKPGGRISAQTVAQRYLDIAEHTVGASKRTLVDAELP